MEGQAGKAGPAEDEDSSAAQARGCKVRGQPGIHHRPNRRCGIEATRGSIDGPPKERDAGRPGDQSIGSDDGPEI